MRCPNCGEEKSGVLRTVKSENKIVRYRRCKNCSIAFKTVEILSEDKDLLDQMVNSYRDMLFMSVVTLDKVIEKGSDKGIWSSKVNKAVKNLKKHLEI